MPFGSTVPASAFLWISQAIKTLGIVYGGLIWSSLYVAGRFQRTRKRTSPFQRSFMLWVLTSIWRAWTPANLRSVTRRREGRRFVQAVLLMTSWACRRRVTEVTFAFCRGPDFWTICKANIEWHRLRGLRISRSGRWAVTYALLFIGYLSVCCVGRLGRLTVEEQVPTLCSWNGAWREQLRWRVGLRSLSSRVQFHWLSNRCCHLMSFIIAKVFRNFLVYLSLTSRLGF